MSEEFDGNDGLEFDMSDAVSEVASQLGLGGENYESDDTEESVSEVEESSDNEDSDEQLDDESSKEDAEENIEEVSNEMREAPKSWAKDQHEIWRQLPKQAQDYIELREKQMLDGLDEYKAGNNYARELDSIISPYRETFRNSGIDEKTAIGNLLQWNQALLSGDVQERLHYYQQLGKTLGLDEASIQREKEMPPEVRSMQQELNQLKRQNQDIQQKAYEIEYNKSLDEVRAFAADEEHEHFEVLQDDIVSFVQAGMSLKDAYERAVWANPITREIEQNKIFAEKEQADAKAREEALKKAEEAKRNNIKASKVNNSSKKERGKTLMDTLAMKYDEIQNRN